MARDQDTWSPWLQLQVGGRVMQPKSLDGTDACKYEVHRFVVGRRQMSIIWNSQEPGAGEAGVPVSMGLQKR